MRTANDPLELLFENVFDRLRIAVGRPALHGTLALDGPHGEAQVLPQQTSSRSVRVPHGRLEIDLARNQYLKLVRAEGTHIVCLSGRLWITEEGDSRDHLLQAGCDLTLLRSGAAVLSALAPARISIQAGTLAWSH